MFNIISGTTAGGVEKNPLRINGNLISHFLEPVASAFKALIESSAAGKRKRLDGGFGEFESKRSTIYCRKWCFYTFLALSFLFF